jgi:hypothetical protein
MLENLTLDHIKQIIIEEGGAVSDITPPGPVTVIFTKVVSPVYIGDTVLNDVYEKYCLEYSSYKLHENINNFRKTVKDIVSSSTKTTIFSLYQLIKMEDYILLRFGCLNSYYGEQNEVSIEEAKDLIKNPPTRMSVEYIQDLKAIYGL